MNLTLRSRRHRRLAATVLFSAAFGLTITGILALRPRPAPYIPGEKIQGITESLSREIPEGFTGVSFGDMTEAAGIRFRHFQGRRTSQLPEDMGSGAAWGDFDRDGWPDLFLANEAGPLTLSPDQIRASPARCALFRNVGGSFVDVTESAGLGQLRGWYMGAAWGDYDNDGFPDLVVTAYGRNRLFHSEGSPGGGKKDSSPRLFREVTERAGLSAAVGFWAGASWADYDRDGDLDLYICGYVRYRPPRGDEAGAVSRQFESEVPFTLNPSSYPPEKNLLYRNEGGGRFTEVAHAAGVDNPEGRSLSAAWCDFDNDSWPDLYVNNDVSMHAFYRNRGGGRFEDITASSWACDYRGGMGIAVGDWDTNGDMDLFLTHWIAQENALYHNMRSFERRHGASKRGPLRFVDISDQVGLGQSSLDYIGWGASFLDIDNDGRLDLAIANGSTFEEPSDRTRLIPMRNQIFWNGCQNRGYMESGSRDRGFFDVTELAGSALSAPNIGRGLAVADYDRDGAPDILILRHGAAPLLARNRENPSRGAWVGLELRGTRSNRDGVGAKVSLKAGGLTQTRIVGAQPSYLSQDELTLHFGLGKAAVVDEVAVTWPSGTSQAFKSLPVNRYYRLEEGGLPEGIRAARGARP